VKGAETRVPGAFQSRSATARDEVTEFFSRKISVARTCKVSLKKYVRKKISLTQNNTKKDKGGTDYLSVHIKTKGKLPRLPFASLKEALLGKRYALSIVFIGDQRSRRLNKTYRGKDAPANVLSFPLSTTEGELFINPREARRDAPKFNQDVPAFLLFLVIHGMLHLKGYAHGSTMSAQEQRCMKKFGSTRTRARTGQKIQMTKLK